MAFRRTISGTAAHQLPEQKLNFTDTKPKLKITDPPLADQNPALDRGNRGRVIVFIDGSNLFYAALELSIKIDYAKLLHYLTARDYLVHVFFYTGYDPVNEKQHQFLHWMSHNGFRVITKALTQAVNGSKSANLDVEIAVDMMGLAHHCDTVVLVIGDGDFAYVVNTIINRGVRVEVIGLRSMTSGSLIESASCYIDLATIQKTVQKPDALAVNDWLGDFRQTTYQLNRTDKNIPFRQKGISL